MRKYSDHNLKAALQARTEMFSDKAQVKHGGLEGAPPIAVARITPEMSALEASELWARILEQGKADEGDA
jgi:hypothetical protein